MAVGRQGDILTILVTSQLLMELLMDTEELVSVRPVLPSAPSSSCALAAALTGTREAHRENTPERSMSEHFQCRAFCRCATALMFPFHFSWSCTGQGPWTHPSPAALAPSAQQFPAKHRNSHPYAHTPDHFVSQLCPGWF